MKNKPFSGLLYREFFLIRKSYVSCFVSLFIISLLSLLALLSMKYGNLALLLSDDPDIKLIDNELLSDAFRFEIVTMIKFMPMIMAAAFCYCPSEVAGKDVLNKWDRFVHCTPVKPAEFAAVKALSTFIGMAVSLGLSVLLMYSFQSALGERFTYGDFSLIVVTVAFMYIYSILSQIFTIILRNAANGTLAATLVLMIPAMIFFGIYGIKLHDINGIEPGESIGLNVLMASVTEKVQKICPVVLVVLALMLAVQFVSLYLLYKRREK